MPRISRRALLSTAAALTLHAKPPASFVRVSRRDPRYLELTDGSPYIPIGLNLIAPPTRGGLDTYRDWLDRLHENGGNYIRAWLSNPFWDTEPERSGVYDEEKARLIDQMLAMVRERGIRVKMTIEHFRSIGGGPQPWADKPLHHIDRGGTAQSIADFFDGEPSRARFRQKLAWLAQRFGNRPEVYGWELWNEINAVRGGDYMAWTQAMLPELHRRFPRNLCMQSLGSFDSDRVREVYRRHSTLPGNDLAQVHRYLDLGAALDVCKGPVDILAADAVREILRDNPGKPVILAESGAVEPRHSGPSHLYAKDREGTLLHDILFAPFFAGAAGPGQIWHWDSYVAPNNLWWHFARFAEAVKGVDPPAENFKPSLLPHPALRIYQLQGRRTTLLWCRDPRNHWRSELEQAESPAWIKAAELNLPPGRPKAFDPWTGQWTDLKREGETTTLPNFRRSLVVKVSRHR